MVKIRQMSRWLQARREPFMAKPFTSILVEWIEHRKSVGIKPVTIWGTDYSYGTLWGEWMHKKGLCEKPDRDRIRESIPPKSAPIVLLPTPAEDAKVVRFFRDNRHTTMMVNRMTKGEEPTSLGLRHHLRSTMRNMKRRGPYCCS